MLKRKIAILLAFALLIGSYTPPVNAKEPDQNDEIYYWKVYTTDIAPGEEDQIEWITPSTWTGMGFSWASYWDLGYDTIEFIEKWGENWVVGSNAKTLSERKVGDTFYYLYDGHLDNHQRRLIRNGWPLAKCTIMSIYPFHDGSSMYNVDVSLVQAYKHIGYARSYNKDMFKKYELDKYDNHPTDWSLYFQRMTEAPTGDVTWVQDEGFQEEQKKRQDDKETVTSIKVTGQPTLSYREGDKLDLSNLAVTLIYKNKSKKVVPYAEFADYDLTTNLENGDPLYINRDNGKTIKIRKGSLKTETEPLVVGEALSSSSPAKVDPVREGDKKISGQGETGADITVKDQDGNTIANTAVDKEGNWSVTLPEDKTLTEGGKLTVTQTEAGKAPTDTTVTVEKNSASSSEPQVNPVYDTDKTIAGQGVSGASIVVTDASDNIIGQTEVDSAGSWEVNLPDGKPLDPGLKLNVTQTEKGKGPATTSTTVQKKETAKPDDKNHKGAGGSSGGGSGFIPGNTDKNKTTDADKNKDNKQDDKNKDNKSNLSIKDLNTRDHYRYMMGYEDKTFRPNREMTRAEVATMFVRLLDNKSASSSQAKTFKDVKAKDWYADLVAYASYRGIVSGYPDGTFKPNAPISRAEFASIAARFADLTKTEPLSFSDVAKTNWAYDSIAKAATKNWLSGYPDGTFRPNNKINRAEVTSITNRMLGRKADLDWLAKNPGQVVSYKDVDKDAWWYGDIMEASNGHDYDKAGKAKVWTRLNHKSFA